MLGSALARDYLMQALETAEVLGDLGVQAPGSELPLESDMSFTSRERAILSQWEVGAALVPGGGPMARLPRLIGREHALEVLLEHFNPDWNRGLANPSRSMILLLPVV